jgi:hypothetical protein
MGFLFVGLAELMATERGDRFAAGSAGFNASLDFG